MTDEYYQLARMLSGMDRKLMSIELRKLHSQALDQALERVLNVLGQAELESWSMEKIRENVRAVRLRGVEFATDRAHLRRCEAVLFALGDGKNLVVPERVVAAAYDDGDGVEIGSIDGSLEIGPHRGKFAGK